MGFWYWFLVVCFSTFLLRIPGLNAIVLAQAAGAKDVSLLAADQRVSVTCIDHETSMNGSLSLRICGMQVCHVQQVTLRGTGKVPQEVSGNRGTCQVSEGIKDNMRSSFMHGPQ